MYFKRDGKWNFAVGPIVEDGVVVPLNLKFNISSIQDEYKCDKEFSDFVNSCFERMKQERPNLYDNVLVCLNDAPSINGRTLEMNLGLTNYRHFMATSRAIEEDDIETIRASPLPLTFRTCSRVLNYMPAVVSADNKLIYTERGGNVASHRGVLASFGPNLNRMLSEEEYMRETKKTVLKELMSEDIEADLQVYGVSETRSYMYSPLLILIVNQEAGKIIENLHEASGKLKSPLDKKYDRISILNLDLNGENLAQFLNSESNIAPTVEPLWVMLGIQMYGTEWADNLPRNEEINSTTFK